MSQHRCWFLLALLLAYGGLGVGYSFASPAFEAPDEASHFGVVRHLADGQGLPVQGRPSPFAMVQEAGQPPLYYLLGAALTFWVDAGPPEAFYQLNPHAKTGFPLAQHNRNLVLHPPGERSSWEGRLLALRLLRWLGVLLGLGTVLSTYALARTVAPGGQAFPLAAAALVAFHPMYLFVSSSVSNDALMVPLGAATTLLLVRIAGGRDGWRMLLLLGIALGAALLTKLSGLIFLPLAALVLSLRAWRDPGRAALLLGLPMGMAILLAGSWYLRNLALYGDPTGLQPFLATVGSRTVSLGQLWEEREGLFYSFWGLFGTFNILMPQGIYRALLLLSGLGALGCLLPWLRGQRPPQIGALLVMASVLLLNLLGLLRWTSLTLGSQGRLLYPSLAAIAVLLAWGLAQWAPRHLGRGLLGLAVAAMALLAVAAPLAFILPAYPGPERLTDESAIPHNSYVRLGEFAELIGYELSKRDLRAGEELEVTLYWRALRTADRLYSLYLHLGSPIRPPIAQVDSYPAGGGYATTWWRPGELLRERYRLTIPTDIDRPQGAMILVGWYDYSGCREEPDSCRRVPAYDGEGRPTTPQIARLRLAPRTWAPAAAPQEGIDFGGFLRLAQLRVEPLRLAPGEEVVIQLGWYALEPPGIDYTLFLHLVPEANPRQVLAQGDRLLGGSDYPTGLWPQGEALTESYRLVVPERLEPGRYRLLGGLYDLASGQRLTMAADPENAVTLAALEVVAP